MPLPCRYIFVFAAFLLPVKSLPELNRVSNNVFFDTEVDRNFNGDPVDFNDTKVESLKSENERTNNVLQYFPTGLSDGKFMREMREKYRRTLASSSLRAEDVDTVEVGQDKNGFLDWLYQFIGVTTTTPKPTQIPPKNCDPCLCGKTNKKRIVGGQETEINQYPWMALLLHNKNFYCAGSLINDRYILTAAHCVSGFKQEKISIRLMEHNRETEDESETITRYVKGIFRHQRYSNQNYNNDIALIEMDEPVVMKGPLRPVCMPPSGRSFTGFDGIVTGWGALEEGGAIATSLQEVTVPIISNNDCRKTAYGEKRITDNMLCAGFPEGEKDSCQGDSGGPLHVLNATTNLHQVAGIVSWGEGCAQADHPGVYTRVNRYLSWIKSNTRNACYC